MCDDRKYYFILCMDKNEVINWSDTQNYMEAAND